MEADIHGLFSFTLKLHSVLWKEAIILIILGCMFIAIGVLCLLNNGRDKDD